jgi:hypothetical protein
VALQVLNTDKMDVVRALTPVPTGTSF